jgi:hypothetical protein
MLVTLRTQSSNKGSAMQPRDYGPFPYTPISGPPKLEWPGGARLAGKRDPALRSQNRERFESFPLPDSYANVRQLARRKGKV